MMTGISSRFMTMAMSAVLEENAFCATVEANPPAVPQLSAIICRMDSTSSGRPFGDMLLIHGATVRCTPSM